MLGLYLADGRVEIDNNLVKKAIHPTAIGKKNWLIVGEAHAGERGAILYTVIEICRRRAIDPCAYLRDVLTRLPTMTNHQIPEVTPEALGKKQRPSPQQAAVPLRAGSEQICSDISDSHRKFVKRSSA